MIIIYSRYIHSRLKNNNTYKNNNNELFFFFRYGVPPEVDYIHANYVKTTLCKLDNKYICTQVRGY